MESCHVGQGSFRRCDWPLQSRLSSADGRWRPVEGKQAKQGGTFQGRPGVYRAAVVLSACLTWSRIPRRALYWSGGQRTGTYRSPHASDHCGTDCPDMPMSVTSPRVTRTDQPRSVVPEWQQARQVRLVGESRCTSSSRSLAIGTIARLRTLVMADGEAKVDAVGSDGRLDGVKQVGADDEVCADDGWFERPVVATVDEVAAPLPAHDSGTVIVDENMPECRRFRPKV